MLLTGELVRLYTACMAEFLRILCLARPAEYRWLNTQRARSGSDNTDREVRNCTHGMVSGTDGKRQEKLLIQYKARTVNSGEPQISVFRAWEIYGLFLP